jgi:hypothetical protein
LTLTLSFRSLALFFVADQTKAACGSAVYLVNAVASWFELLHLLEVLLALCLFCFESAADRISFGGHDAIRWHHHHHRPFPGNGRTTATTMTTTTLTTTTTLMTTTTPTTTLTTTPTRTTTTQGRR